MSQICKVDIIMKDLIPRVKKSLLKKELTADKFMRPTNRANNEIYIITAHNSPNVMREIGRLRELSFRSWGGGTGDEIDTDKYDFMEKPYKQLIVWNPEKEEIVGGYRYLTGKEVEFDTEGQPKFVMSHLFTFGQNFIQNYLPNSIELGRAFVQPKYQTTQMGMKSLFSLDNLWDGLGALVHYEKDVDYFIGKVTLYNSYPKIARELLYEYLNLYFPDNKGLIFPKMPYQISDESVQMAKMLFTENDAKKDYKILQKALKKIDVAVPAMFNAYIGLTNTMKTFGTIVDKEWSNVLETGIMLTVNDLEDNKRKRHIESYMTFLRKKLDEYRENK